MFSHWTNLVCADNWPSGPLIVRECWPLKKFGVRSNSVTYMSNTIYLMSPYRGVRISNYGWWKDWFDVLGFEMLDRITLDEVIELSQAHAMRTISHLFSLFFQLSNHSISWPCCNRQGICCCQICAVNEVVPTLCWITCKLSGMTFKHLG